MVGLFSLFRTILNKGDDVISDGVNHTLTDTMTGRM